GLANVEHDRAHPKPCWSIQDRCLPVSSASPPIGGSMRPLSWNRVELETHDTNRNYDTISHYHDEIVEANPSPSERRHRPPRVPGNPMARVAREIAKDAIEEAGNADSLTAGMEPHLQRRLGGSALYAYTNDRAVPPGDVLLAMALATGISLDDRLGIGRGPSEVQRQLAA